MKSRIPLPQILALVCALVGVRVKAENLSISQAEKIIRIATLNWPSTGQKKTETPEREGLRRTKISLYGEPVATYLVNRSGFVKYLTVYSGPSSRCPQFRDDIVGRIAHTAVPDISAKDLDGVIAASRSAWLQFNKGSGFSSAPLGPFQFTAFIVNGCQQNLSITAQRPRYLNRHE